MESNNVDDKDLLEKESKEELKNMKKILSDYKKIISFYDDIKCYFHANVWYFKIENIQNRIFFNNINIFFGDLDYLDWTVRNEINEEKEYNGDQEKINNLQGLKELIFKISLYEKIFKKKEKWDLVDSDICINLALILDLILFIKFYLRDNPTYYSEIDYYIEEMIEVLYNILDIETLRKNKFGRFPIKYVVMHFFKRSSLSEFDSEDYEAIYKDLY